MKKYLLLLICCCMALPALLSGQESFKIRNVKSPWYPQAGTYDKTVITVKPKGQYVECGMYLNFSTYGTTFTSADSLEIVMQFNLPQKAELTDLWLWVGDDIMRGIIMDKWTASTIYNGIVHLRQDPAIIMKTGTNQYSLRVFPLMTNLPRRIKITYMLPIDDYSNSLSAVQLPINVMKLTKTEREPLKILYWPTQNTVNPKLAEDIPYIVTPLTDPTYGNYYQLDVPNYRGLPSLNITVENAQANQKFIGKYQKENSTTGYYQMKIYPNQLFEVPQGDKKAIFLFDFINANTSSLSKIQILDGLKKMLKENFTAQDKFNIAFSGLPTNMVSPNWLSGDSVTINNAFAQLSASSFNNFSSLPTLLLDGINYIKDHNNDGTIVLVANSSSHGDISQANSLITAYLNTMGSAKIPIHIIDLDNRSNPNLNNIGGVNYRGNEYLYLNLARQTVGEYLSLRNLSYTQMLTSTKNKFSDYLTGMDIYTTLQSGYTFANYNMNGINSIYYLDQPYFQVGKYAGSTPFKIIASGQLSSGEFLHKEVTIENSDIVPLDSMCKAVWSAQYLRSLAAQVQTNSVINEIIQVSVENRVLSNYTAFLCLEPSEENLPYNGLDETIFVGIEQNVKPDSTDFELNNYPNPFNPATTISYKISKPAVVKLAVYNTKGEEVAVLVNRKEIAGKHQVFFDGNTMASGIYFYSLVVDNKLVSRKKMMLIK